MSSSIFLDTSGWLAILNSGDALHPVADKIWREQIEQGRKVVVTDWIIAETGNGSAKSRRRHRVAEAIQAILLHPRIELVYVDNRLLNQSLAFFGQYADKSWGLVDCASFLVMQDHGIIDAFTSDKHFEQAGFRCLLTI